MFEYRGFHLDSVRHMQSIDEIKKFIDAMAILEFNKFHWHLTDDQGWRFECESFPELNSKAAVRPYSDFGKKYINEPYGRVYTRDEMREIVEYCAAKGIDVVPEFDMPGHSSALLSVFPDISCTGNEVKIKTHQGIFSDILCPAKEKTYEVVTRILDEFLDIFPGEYIHIGGDETPFTRRKECPECRQKMKELGIEDHAEYQNIFMNRIIDYLESRGRHCIVWNDSVKGKNLDKRAVIQYWKENDRAGVDFINSGGKSILSPFSYCYLDYDYDITPLNRVYSLRAGLPGLTDAGRKNIIGIEGTLWTEYIDNDRRLEELAFPRIIAVSKAALGEERGSYKEFLNEINEYKKELPGISFGEEKDWTHSRASIVPGWLRFVKNNYSKEYIINQLTHKE